MTICRTVFNTLIEYDHKTLQPLPGLAQSWELKGDTLTFRLRPGVTYHSGRPFDARDVVFAITNLHKDNVSSQLKHVAKAIADIDSDGLDVRLKLARPMSNVFDLFEILVIPDRESIAELAKGSRIIGTGPFRVASYSPGAGLKLRRNEKYFKPSRPYLDGVDITIVSQSQSMLSSMRSGQTHLVLDIAPLDAVGITNDRRFKVVAADPYDSAYYVASNVSVKPLDDKRVRQAIAWGIDRQRILDQVLGGIGTTSSLPWSPTSPAYDAAKARHYTYNPDRAKELIREAGARGARLDIVYNAGLGANARIAEIVQYNLSQAGIDARAVPLQAADFQGRLTGGKLPGLFVNGHGFGQLAPATLVKGAFPFNADKNASNFVSPEYQSIANALWSAADPAATKAASDRVNDFLLDQQFVTDLVTSAHTFTVTKRLRGLAYSMFDYLNLDDAYLD
ncbi:ABC transporter substrate-binding protein [Embleya scabrispora]|nr:ABC transporter substrate-binding protein [Embleya scabrispora]